MTGPAIARRSIETVPADGKIQAAEQRRALMVRPGAFARNATQLLAVAKACLDAGRPVGSGWLCCPTPRRQTMCWQPGASPCAWTSRNWRIAYLASPICNTRSAHQMTSPRRRRPWLPHRGCDSPAATIARERPTRNGWTAHSECSVDMFVVVHSPVVIENQAREIGASPPLLCLQHGPGIELVDSPQAEDGHGAAA